MSNENEIKNILELSTKAPSGKEILKASLEVTKILIEKNISYGDSALHPAGIFSKGSATEQLSARLDDKLNRIKNNQSYQDESMIDAVDDIIGYLVLLKIAVQNEKDVQKAGVMHSSSGQIFHHPV